MDESLEHELTKRIEEASAPLHPTIHVGKELDSKFDYAIIDIGNTGMEIEITKIDDRPNLWLMHYMPNEDPVPAKNIQDKIKYATIFGYALYHFIEWWKEEKNFDSAELPRQNIVFGKPNEAIRKFLKNNLGKEIYREIPPSKIAENVLEGDELIDTSIDLKKLYDDKDLMAKLEKLKDRCEKKKYKMYFMPDLSNLKNFRNR